MVHCRDSHAALLFFPTLNINDMPKPVLMQRAAAQLKTCTAGNAKVNVAVGTFICTVRDLKHLTWRDSNIIGGGNHFLQLAQSAT